MNALKGKVAIVTGGAGGIGGAQAKQFVAEGAKVVIADLADDPGHALAATLGESAVYQRLDVRDERSWVDAVAATVDRWGGVDILVNTAGIASYRLIQNLTVEHYMNMIQINQIGVFLGIRSVIGAMTARGGGSIINVSSYVGVRADRGRFAYSSTKFAVRAMTQAAAIELAPQGIRVNALLPGVIDTPPVQGMAPEDRAEMTASIAMGRLGGMDEAARMTVFLASDESSYCTGADFYVDGGAAISSGSTAARAARAKP